MTTATAPKTPTCHPDAPYMACGLCRRCYVASRAAKLAPIEPLEPGSHQYVLGLRVQPPPRLDGLVHHCFTEWPSACPKCRRGAALSREGRELWCRGAQGGCGWTGYLVSQTSISTASLRLNRKGELIAGPLRA